jgi:hypothetical protein
MTPARKKEKPTYFFGFHDGQLCVVDAAGEAIMKVRPEDIERLVQTLLADGLPLSGLEDALAEGMRLGIDVIEWDRRD